MAHLGLLLACEHYPILPRNPDRMDGQLRQWLRALGHEVEQMTAYDCHRGDLPKTTGDADLWLVSGQPLGLPPCRRDLAGALYRFLRGAAATGRPIYGLYHGEHVLHAALAAPGAEEPGGPQGIRSIRNPFWSFQSRDRLFAFHPSERRVVALDRPQNLTRRAIFARLPMLTAYSRPAFCRPLT